MFEEEARDQKMRYSRVLMVLATVSVAAFGQKINETQARQNITETQPANATARRGRHVHEIIELPPPGKKTKRQIITIPRGVSKMKIVTPPLNIKYNRAPQQFTRHPDYLRRGVARKSFNGKTHSDFPNPFPYDLKNPTVKDEEFEPAERPRKMKKHKSVVKIKRKRPKQNVPNEYLIDHGGDEQEFDTEKIRSEESEPFRGFHPAGSSIHTKQVLPPKFTTRQTQPMDALTHFYDENYVPSLQVKKLSTKGRQVQSLFPQHYTTHNPHVATNFGLTDAGRPNGYHYEVVNGFPFAGSGNQGAASNQVATAVPVDAPGIQVIQPPQFRDVTGSHHPSHPSRLVSSLSQQQEETSSQKATIRDILEQDCPGYDSRGYCDSPPRYPMQQIKNLVKKCANLMEVMNTQPFEEPREVYGSGSGSVKRSDDYEERKNKSASVDSASDSFSTWSRSTSDGHAACISDLEFVEPGYGKEVDSGRWFVIVQHPDTTIQRIATDTCSNPGKSCRGLSEMKCSKINNFASKSTTCVQRHTYQRLISWDPESPDECPRMRVFRFPSACVCHLGVI